MDLKPQHLVEYNFDDQDWNVLLTTPILAGLTVAHAHASGWTGVQEEYRVLANCFEETADDHAVIVYLKSEVLKRGLLDEKRGTNGTELKSLAQGQILMVRGLLERKSNSEIYRAYTDFLGKVLSRVAGAAREGGLFNAEPNKISDLEMQVMADLLKMLD
ncbi:hypothetical protein [Deinococcus roseus]|uniref:Uncharacterized protein n=1 Tax=Deinococcus roseus TaxID=392414 RepID=A0ABQ2D4T5_9DEIO|nr:hypothetical protein [Deinococcus roseus]GGJ39883.1 hypothetical protein GCM10008938_27360 [Deinococcus roseus]